VKQPKQVYREVYDWCNSEVKRLRGLMPQRVNGPADEAFHRTRILQLQIVAGYFIGLHDKAPDVDEGVEDILRRAFDKGVAWKSRNYGVPSDYQVTNAITGILDKLRAEAQPVHPPMRTPKTETPEPEMTDEKTPTEKLVYQVLHALTELERIRKSDPEAYATAMREQAEARKRAKVEALSAASTAIAVLLASGVNYVPKEPRKWADEVWREELEALAEVIENRLVLANRGHSNVGPESKP